MGNATWDKTDWSAHSTRTASMPRATIFKSSSMKPELDPAKFKYREARDSDANPKSTPIIICCDVTGSMGYLAEQIVKTDLGAVMQALYDRKPVTDPAIAIGATGDCNVDEAPFQVTQFESSMALVEQLKNIWLESGGGGNSGETYALAWAFAAYKTKVDSIWKRGHKGYLFTIGDECCLPTIKKEHLKRFLDLDAPEDLDTKVLFEHAKKDWEIFHLIVNPVDSQPVVDSWRSLIGERAIVVKDHTKLAVGIVALIQMIEGGDVKAATEGWDAEGMTVARSVSAQLLAT